jgi:hypothetical protein
VGLFYRALAGRVSFDAFRVLRAIA